MQLVRRRARNPILYAVIMTMLIVGLAVLNARVWESQAELDEALLSLDLGYSSAQQLDHLSDDLFEITRSKILGFPHRPEIQTVYIDVNPEEYRVLLQDRERALANSVLSAPTEVNGKLRFEDKRLNIDVRLKGDLLDHWVARRRMSLRVKIKGDESVLGFNEFSLQKPASRQHPYDQVFQALMRRAGNLSAVSDYLRVVFNGEDWGVMNMEEGMTSEFVEKLERKESLLVRFADEEAGLHERVSVMAGVPVYSPYRISDSALVLKMYEQRKYAMDSNFRKWFSYVAQERIAQLGEGTELYDADAYSRALLMATFWNDGHSLWHANSRHYFNPYTLRLEPVTTDAYLAFPIGEARSHFPRRAFDPLQNIDVYNYLLSTGGFSASLDRNYPVAREAVSFAEEEYRRIHRYFPLDDFDEDFITVLRDNVRILDSKVTRDALFQPSELLTHSDLSPPTDEQARLLSDHVHIRHFENGRLEVYNLLPVDVRLKTIRAGESAPMHMDVIVPGYKAGRYEPLTVQTDFLGFLDAQLQVETEFRGLQRTTVSELSFAVDDMHNPLLSPYRGGYDFLTATPSGGWQINAGEWLIDRAVVLEGDLKIMPGATLRFDEGSYLIVHGAIEAAGSETQPIIMEALNEEWKGIYVYEATRRSTLRNATIREYGALEDGILSLTGGITFYRSDVQIENVALSDTRGEDALNIVESEFEITALSLRDTFSDGIDSDYSTGSITDSSFTNINGDATDFSGSEVSLEGIVAEGVYDKVVSVGEASRVRVSGGRFRDVGVGVVSKDGSVTYAENLTIEPYVLSAIMSYEKKSFYDKASIDIQNIDAAGDMAFLRQEGSAMRLNGREVPPRSIDVDALYENTVMRK